MVKNKSSGEYKVYSFMGIKEVKYIMNLKKLSENRKFEVIWHFVGWGSLSFGFHIDFYVLNIEIHLPFGFIRIGYESKYDYYYIKRDYAQD